jgi:hypothetical protein
MLNAEFCGLKNSTFNSTQSAIVMAIYRISKRLVLDQWKPSKLLVGALKNGEVSVSLLYASVLFCGRNMRAFVNL